MVFPWLRRSYESPAIVEAGSGNRVTQTVTVGKPEAVTVIMVALQCVAGCPPDGDVLWKSSCRTFAQNTSGVFVSKKSGTGIKPQYETRPGRNLKHRVLPGRVLSEAAASTGSPCLNLHESAFRRIKTWKLEHRTDCFFSPLSA